MADLKAAITPASGAYYRVYNENGEEASLGPILSFDYTIIVFAEDEFINKAYKIIVNGLEAGEASALNAKISEATAAEIGKVEGTEFGNQIVGSKDELDKAIGEAKAVYDARAKKTQVDLDAATTKLNAAITVYKKSVVSVEGASELNDKIVEATAAESGKIEGSEIGNQTIGSTAKLDTAIEEAQAVYDVRRTKSPAELNAATAKLDIAITKYKNSVITHILFYFGGEGQATSKTVISGSTEKLRLDYRIPVETPFANGTVTIEFPEEITITTSDTVICGSNQWRQIESSEISPDGHTLKFTDINYNDNTFQGGIPLELYNKEIQAAGTYIITAHGDPDGSGTTYEADTLEVKLISVQSVSGLSASNQEVAESESSTIIGETTDQEAADAVNSLIAALPEEGNVTLGDQAQIEAASSAYKNLTTAQQGLVTNVAKLTAAEAKLSTLTGVVTDQEAADAVNSLIAALPEEGNVILGNQAQIEAARAAFIDLTAAQQGLVTNIAKLTAAEGKLLTLIEAADYEAANAVSSSIAALPEAGSVTLENQAEIEAARAAYNNLKTEQKGFVTNVEKLEAAEAELANP